MQTTCKMSNSKPKDVPRTLKFTTENTTVYIDKPSIGEGKGNKQFLLLISCFSRKQ